MTVKWMKKLCIKITKEGKPLDCLMEYLGIEQSLKKHCYKWMQHIAIKIKIADIPTSGGNGLVAKNCG